MKHLLLAALLTICASATSAPDDAYAIFVVASGPRDPRPFPDIDRPCLQLIWGSDVLFFNTGAEDLRVTLLGTSNGASAATDTTLTIPPHVAVSLASHNIGRTWRPRRSEIGILHLDIPPLITAASRLELLAFNSCIGDAPVTPQYGTVALPLFKTLRSANQQQIHLLADRGSLNARINVAIYNAGNDAALATVELHESCTDAMIESRSVSIDANTLYQVQGLQTSRSRDCYQGGLDRNPNRKTPAWMNYVIVTVDRPSVTYVSSIATDQFPTASVGVSAP